MVVEWFCSYVSMEKECVICQRVAFKQEAIKVVKFEDSSYLTDPAVKHS